MAPSDFSDVIIQLNGSAPLQIFKHTAASDDGIETKHSFES